MKPAAGAMQSIASWRSAENGEVVMDYDSSRTLDNVHRDDATVSTSTHAVGSSADANAQAFCWPPSQTDSEKDVIDSLRRALRRPSQTTSEKNVINSLRRQALRRPSQTNSEKAAIQSIREQVKITETKLNDDEPDANLIEMIRAELEHVETRLETQLLQLDRWPLDRLDDLTSSQEGRDNEKLHFSPILATGAVMVLAHPIDSKVASPLALDEALLSLRDVPTAGSKIVFQNVNTPSIRSVDFVRIEENATELDPSGANTSSRSVLKDAPQPGGWGVGGLRRRNVQTSQVRSKSPVLIRREGSSDLLDSSWENPYPHTEAVYIHQDDITGAHISIDVSIHISIELYIFTA